jgi:MFS transporter, PAT family, beta-lactamase induction signal transducer AmpG
VNRYLPPPWLKGLTGASFGLYTGFLVIPLPQALAAQHVPEAAIASITALVISPSFFIFLISPILDVRFSRRWYATVFTAAAAVLLGLGVLVIRNPLLLEIVLTAGCAAIVLSYGALGGWLSSVSPKEEENRLSAYLTAANAGGVGLITVFGGELIRSLPLPAVAVMLMGLVVLPLLIFPWIPAPGPDRRLAGESFRAFSADVFALLRRGPVLIALALFATPCGTFSLTNLLGGLGNDFHASPRVVSLLGGFGVLAAGVGGSLLLPPLAKRIPLRPLYLTIGVVGAIFTLSLLALPRTPGVFGVALIGEQVFQSVAIACSIAVSFETMGQNNPLAATTFSVLSAAYNLPITYMLVVDGRGYSWRGINGAFIVDAGLGIAACLLLAMLLVFVRRIGLDLSLNTANMVATAADDAP